MQLLDLALPTAAENLALDEALLEAAESDLLSTEVLRLWEPAAPLVVVGRSSQVAVEVNLPACHERGISVLRRSSGGAAIVAGPGCLMYAVVLNLELRAHLRAIDEAHAFVLGRLATALSRLLPGISRQGTSDLALGDRKFSGNSLRIKRRHALYHGTLLYDFPLSLIGELLAAPPRQPPYRQSRLHADFLTNLPLQREQLRQALIEAWQAGTPLIDWPRALTASLVAEKYSQPAWNARH
jgi:lipoate-protein ligase A